MHGNDRPQHLLATHLPGAEPGTDGVAVFEGRIIGRIMHMTNLPRDPKPWTWSITDPELAGRPGWATTHGEMPSRRQAMDRLIERWPERDLPGGAALELTRGPGPAGKPCCPIHRMASGRSAVPATVPRMAFVVRK